MKIILKFIVLVLSFSTLSVAQNERPQTPEAPFNYNIEEVSFINIEADSIKLAGTLTLPKNKKKSVVAILINGSGPLDRDCTIYNHKPFWVIADYLTNNGIAVLRFDERGTAKSEGDYSKATTYDLASDVEAGINYLKTRTDIDASKIGLIGHSEGGVIAPIIASSNKDVAFTVLLAGPGVAGDVTLYTQNEKIMAQSGATPEAVNFQLDISKNLYRIVKTTSNDSLATKISTYLDKYKEDNKDSKVLPFLLNPLTKIEFMKFSKPWLREFVRLDPEPFLLKTKCPVLALNGSKDVQVIPDLNLNAIEAALKKGENKDFTLKEIEGLNHLFQTIKTGSTSEYATLEETFSSEVLKLIANWINTRF